MQGFFRQNGAALVKRLTLQKCDINGTSVATRVVFICDRGPQRPSTSIGLRQTSSQKLDCPYRLIVTASQEQEIWKWKYRVTNNHHNHGPSLDPSAHNVHRRRTLKQQALELSISKQKAVPAREMGGFLRDEEPTSPFFRPRDIYNDRQKLRFFPVVEKQLHKRSSAIFRIAVFPTASNMTKTVKTRYKESSGPILCAR